MSKFKVGDKVRVDVREYHNGINYEKGIIEDIQEDDDGSLEYVVLTCYYGVYDNKYAIVTEDKLELIESYDPKREFLEKLGGLLREYDAKITQNYGCFDIAFNGKWVHTIEGGDNFELTADNIMNFEKD